VTISERTITLDDDDLAEIDDWGSVNEWQPNYGPSQGLIYRAFRAIYEVRPPEPKTVTLDGKNYVADPLGNWYHPNGTRISPSSSIALSLALDHIWELEHPDGEADR